MPNSSGRGEPEPVPADDLTSFLGLHTPFQGMAPDELSALASGSALVPFGPAQLVADYSTRVPDDVWMVRSGHVSLTGPDGAVIDAVGPGGLFGYTPLLTAGSMDFAAYTVGPTTLIRLPGGLVRAHFARPAGLAFLAASAWTTGYAERPTVAPATDSRPVTDLLRGDVLLVASDTSVRDAVVQMTARGVSYALTRSASGVLGIFTDRDLRARVVAEGRPVDVPVGSVASAPARTVTADLTAEAVLMEMLECGLRHMPVITARGEVLGVLEDADLLAASARQSFTLRRAIGSAVEAAELEAAGRGVSGMAVDLFRNGTKASATSAIVSVVIDSLVRRALQIATGERAQRDPPPVDGFAWLSLGSVARREAMPSSDVDSALSWRDDLDPRADGLRALAARVHQILEGCGLPSDSNGAMADRPNFARSQSQWRAAAHGWLDDPLRDRGVVLSSLMIDGRVVWGDPALNTVAAAYRGMARDHPNALRLQRLNALSDRVRARSLRDVLSRRGGTFDVKSHAITPIVNLARWGGLAADVTSASTPTRLRAAAEAGAVTEADATTLTEVFVMLQRLRMAHQVEQLAGGFPPGNVMTMSELSPLNRSLVGDGLREIAAVQRRVRSAAGYGSG